MPRRRVRAIVLDQRAAQRTHSCPRTVTPASISASCSPGNTPTRAAWVCTAATHRHVSQPTQHIRLSRDVTLRHGRLGGRTARIVTRQTQEQGPSPSESTG